MVVVEASARATPSVVVAGEDNAAVELVEDGVNGVIAASDDPATIAAAIVRVHEGGLAMRQATAALVRRTTPSGCRSSPRCGAWLTATRRPAQRRSSPASAEPCAPR